MSAFGAVAAVVLGLVGLVAAGMAGKGLRARRWLPFHQQAAGRSWDEASPSEQAVALALTRSLGLGFLVAALSLLGAALAVALGAAPTAVVLASGGLLFCAGLAVINHRLARSTGSSTPWKEAIYAAALIAVGIALLLVS